MKFKHIIFAILLTTGSIAIILLSITNKSYDDDCLFQKFPSFSSGNDTISLQKLISVDSSKTLEKIFPYQKYLSSDNWKTVSSIRNDLSILDVINKNTVGNINTFSIALTTKMEIWDTSNLDSLNLLFNWADKFDTKSVFSDKYDILLEAVHDYWLGFISQKLDSLNQSNYAIKFDCKFNYLRMRCCQLKFGCGDRDDNNSKIVRHIIEKNWFYLCNRFWIGTTIFFKTICLILVLLTCYGYVCIIQKHKKNKI